MDDARIEEIAKQIADARKYSKRYTPTSAEWEKASSFQRSQMTWPSELTERFTVCVKIYFPDQMRHVSSIADLRELIFPAKVFIRPDYGGVSGDCCLCPMDLDATAAAAGYSPEPDDTDAMGVVWRKCPILGLTSARKPPYAP